MKRVLVTGSEGGIGRYVVDALERQRHAACEVRRVNRYPGLELTTGDLRDRQFCRGLMHGADTVIHAAARRYRPGPSEFPFDLLAHDVDVTTSVLDTAAEVGVRHVVLLSSATVYENAAGAYWEQATEFEPPPSSPLALGKLVAERMVRAWSQQTGGSHTIWRLFNVVTPLEPHDRPGHVHVDLYRKIFVERLPRIRLACDGRQMRCYTWVDDIASAITLWLDDPRARNETFNLGGNDPHAVVQLAIELVAAGYRSGALPSDYEPMFETSDGLSLSATDLVASPALRVPVIAKVCDRFGWKPPTDFATCIERFVQGKARLIK